MKNINVPTGKADVVIDTDTYNEIDDQFAISYLLRSKDKLNTVALYAAPFFNDNSENPCDGMERSYDELLKIIGLCGEEALKKSVFKGSREYLKDENTPVISDAANDLVKRAKMYSPSNPLYVVAIAAITNIASAILIEPDIAKNLVIVWLGGHARHWDHTNEFNMKQDFAAARVIMSSDASVVQLPCMGVVSEFRLSGPDITFWLENKNPLADYLAKNTIKAAEKYAQNKPWTRIIWDVTAVAWLLNENDRFMYSDMVPVRLPGYDGQYEKNELDKKMCYVKHIRRDALMGDLIEKLRS